MKELLYSDGQAGGTVCPAFCKLVMFLWAQVSILGGKERAALMPLHAFSDELPEKERITR